jgi:hypothetical protein
LIALIAANVSTLLLNIKITLVASARLKSIKKDYTMVEG